MYSPFNDGAHTLPPSGRGPRGPSRGHPDQKRSRGERLHRGGLPGGRGRGRRLDRGGRGGVRRPARGGPRRPVPGARPDRRARAPRVQHGHPVRVRPRGRAPGHDHRGRGPARDRERRGPRGDPLHPGGFRGAAAFRPRDAALLRARHPPRHERGAAGSGGPRGLRGPPARAGAGGVHERAWSGARGAGGAGEAPRLPQPARGRARARGPGEVASGLRGGGAAHGPRVHHARGGPGETPGRAVRLLAGGDRGPEPLGPPPGPDPGERPARGVLHGRPAPGGPPRGGAHRSRGAPRGRWGGGPGDRDPYGDPERRGGLGP